MDALKAQFERIRQQLSALTSTQKMLVAALVAIMVLTMLYWGKYAQNADTVSLLGEQSLSPEDIGPIDLKLDSIGVTHTVVGDKIMVPADKRQELLANLMYARALPSDTRSAFETMSKSLTPFASNEERQVTYNQATAADLSDIISRFPGVAEARVVLNSKSVTGVEDNILPSASVFISTRGTVDDPNGLVRAAAEGVAHAVSNLKTSQISVILNRKSMKVPDSQDGTSSDDLNDLRKDREAYLQDKIREILHIDGLSVAVNCDVENRTEDSKIRKMDKANSFTQLRHSESDATETTTNMPVAHEPGVGSNTGGAGAMGTASIDGTGSSASAGPNTSNVTKDINEYEPVTSGTDITYHTPAGKDKVVSAVVNVPLSYFPTAYKRLHPSAPSPDEATLNTAMTAELSRIKESVRNLVALKPEDPITVGYYADAPVDTTVLAAAAAPSTTLSTFKGNAKEIGIGILAIVSLLMMASLVRKSSPPPLALAGMNLSADAGAAIPVARSALNSLGTGEDVAGEVGSGSGALDGVEMDDDSIRTQQVLSQVSAMVKENPDGAAALVKRWLSRP